MHTTWRAMEEDEAKIFFHEQKLFSKERFEEDKINLEWQDLPFFRGHKLVRARISPQRVQLEKDGKATSVAIGTDHRTFFLYNPETSDLRTKVIPLTSRSDSVYLANKLLSPNIDQNSVVQYVQFFGLVVERKGSPFHFLAHENEIPWAPGITDREKSEMMGRFATVTHRNADGSFQIKVTPNRFLGVSFALTIPCIYAGDAFESKMHVAHTGYLRMEHDKGIAEAAFPAQASDLPFYPVKPTGALEAWLKWQRLKTAVFMFGVVMPIGIALFVFGIAGLIGSLSVLIDVVIGSISPSFSAWLNALVARDWVSWSFLIGAATNFLYGVFVLLFVRAAEYVASKRPVLVFDVMIGSIEKTAKKGASTTPLLVWALVKLSALGIASAAVSWVVIFGSWHRLHGNVFDGISNDIAFRSAFGAVLDEMINWLMRGEAPSALRTPIRDFFDYQGSLTNIGRILRLLVGLSIPFVIGEQIRRVLKYRNKPD